MSTFILDITLNNHNNFSGDTAFFIEYCTSAKFKDDKVNYQNNKYFILLDGIVLNKKQLLDQYGQSNWSEFLVKTYQKNGNQFFKELNGSYYGFLFDKEEKKWIIFSDQISSKPVYFTEFKNHICFSNTFTDIVDYLKQKKQKITLNEQAAYLLLSYGYVFEDITITNEIKRLMVGYYAVIQNDKFQLEKFYTLTNNPIEISEREAIEAIDKRFREAVKLAFDKDREYGYQHLATLSGGLDSRMTVYVAHDLGYTSQLNLTFSQSNYLDETIARQISADLKHEWLFKALDNGVFLENIDEITKITGGNVQYSSLAHSMSLYKYLNFNNLGIMHTGQLGDVVISTFYSSLNAKKKFTFGDGAYSSVLLCKTGIKSFNIDYPNEEIFKMYIRGFYGANQGLLGIMNYSETHSPFYDISFMEFCLSLPLKLRFNHYLYKKWILKKYPQIASYIWEKEKVPINYQYWIKVKNKRLPLKEIPTKIQSILGYEKYGFVTKNNMNPLEYWYQTNNQLKFFMDNYFKEKIYLLDDFPELKIDCKKLYCNSNGLEKIQVLSLLAWMKLSAK